MTGLPIAGPVVTPDLEGAGETPFRDRSLELEDLVEQVVAAAEDANATPFDLVGYSLGTAVAAKLPADRVDLVRSLVLIAGVSASDARFRLQVGLWRSLFERDRESLARLLVLSSFSASHLSAMSTEEIEGAVDGFNAALSTGFGRQSELGMRVDLDEVCGRIRTRTLVIGLGRDHVVPTERVRALHRAIPGSDYVELDAGHLVVFERPEELGSIVREFAREGLTPNHRGAR